MTTLGLLAEPISVTEPQPRAPLREVATTPAALRADSLYDQQIQTLVQELFFRQRPSLVRHVGFAAVETQTDTAQLCLNVATALAASSSYDVGLIDGQLQANPLHTHLQMPEGSRVDTSCLIAPRLRLAPRQRWLDDGPNWMSGSSLGRLRTVTMEFDFSILCLDPISWFTAQLSQSCNGVVMVLTANKTRRLVAAQLQRQLHRARVPLLGTILSERRFPVPTGLYRNL